MESVSEQENTRITRFPEECREELSIYCSESGRVVFTSSALKQVLDEDLTGRNLNDFVEDRKVAQLIAKSQAGEGMSFECTLGGLRFSCESTPEHEPDEDVIYIRLLPLYQKGGAFITMNAARFITRELQTDASVLLATLQRLEQEELEREEEEAMERDEEDEEDADEVDEASEARRRELASIRRSVYRLIRTARSLEDCAIAENGLQEMVFREEDLTELCKQMAKRLEPLYQNSGIELNWRLPDGPMPWVVDTEKVRRMLLHLISNATAAQPNGGSITVTLRERDKMAMFSVMDIGSGVKQAVMGDIFRKHSSMDPMRAATAGTGFGLSLVRAFAEGHDGRLLVMSNEGSGTSAQVMLPWRESQKDMVLREFYDSYGAGIDMALVELSTVLSSDCYQA